MTINRKVATLRDVARAAGVSVMTVSNVVNRNFNAMRPDTRERVEQTIRRLGYRPRGTARSLRLDRNFAVGMLIVDPLSSFLADAFISQVVAGLSNCLGERNYGCLVHGVPPSKFESSIFLSDSRTDGICAFLSGDHETRRSYLERLISLHGPVVAIEDTNVGLDSDLAVVRQDDYGAAQELTRRLLDRGCRHFYVLSPDMPWPSVTQRLAGIAHSFGQGSGSGRTLVALNCGRGTIAEAEEVFSRDVGSLPAHAVLIGASDRLSIAAARIAATRSRGGNCDVRLASFSASEESRDLATFDLVAPSVPYQIGVEAGLLMMERIEHGAFTYSERVLPLTLLDRKTVLAACGQAGV